MKMKVTYELDPVVGSSLSDIEDQVRRFLQEQGHNSVAIEKARINLFIVESVVSPGKLRADGTVTLSDDS